MAEVFEELARGTTALYGACAGIWVMIVYAPPIKVDMLLARGTLAAMTKKVPHAFPTITWCLTSAGYRMDADARVAATDVTREFAASIYAQATLVEGEGFQVAAVRAIIAGMDAISRTASKKRVFGDVASAVQWSLEMRKGGLGQSDAVDVTRRIEAARQNLLRGPT